MASSPRADRGSSIWCRPSMSQHADEGDPRAAPGRWSIHRDAGRRRALFRSFQRRASDERLRGLTLSGASTHMGGDHWQDLSGGAWSSAATSSCADGALISLLFSTLAAGKSSAMACQNAWIRPWHWRRCVPRSRTGGLHPVAFTTRTVDANTQVRPIDERSMRQVYRDP